MYGGPAPSTYGGPNRGAPGTSSSSTVVEGSSKATSFHTLDVEETTLSLFSMRGACSRLVRSMIEGRIDPFASKSKSQQMTLKGMIKGVRHLMESTWGNGGMAK
ncbi:hypothetical protein AMTR_s00037p00220970 [Amborella trichopoda]|uniref:Uncharacterized protein n=1 Tax=Amborella trichopoda TaxID=13333 RepID=U5D7L4_AMBTC|nr:hypothetical protein AMTR_s00037p00220970 [Amborella trichopoda]